MGTFKRTVGAAIPLNCQLWDGEPGKFVRAFLTDLDGNVIAPDFVDLAHTREGLYTDDSVAMPDLDVLKATYVVYNDVGYSIESEFHTRGEDSFMKETLTPVQLPDEIIEGEISSATTLKGELITEKAKGEVVTERSSGRAYDPKATGAMTSEQLSGDTKAQKIEGEL